MIFFFVFKRQFYLGLNSPLWE